MALVNLARIVCYIADGAHVRANELLPEMLAHEAWNIPAKTVWKLSLSVDDRNNWLEAMLDNDTLKPIGEWLIETSKKVQTAAMEPAIDELFNHVYRDYYFSDDKRATSPNIYLDYLSDLITLRDKVREYSGENPTLKTFVELVDLYTKYGVKLVSNQAFGDKARVHLMTVHGAKGLEFDSVYMIHGTKDKWLKKSGERFFPSNLHLTLPHELDENLRLIFVAATRAKHRLFISATKKSSTRGEDLTILPILGDIKTQDIETTTAKAIEAYEAAWTDRYTTIDGDLQSLLKPRLAEYKLNATAVNNFTNLEYAGPEQFLLNSLLRFPSAKSANADYGTAIHETLKFAHGFYGQNGKKPTEKEALQIFETQLKRMHMPGVDYEYYMGRGRDYLPKFLSRHEFNNHQQVEQVFNACVGEMRLTGKIDLVEIDEKSKAIKISDFKTGGTFEQFNRGKIKTHNYWQQLMFYKLLIENANNRPGYRIDSAVIEFVEAGDDGIKSLEISYENEDMDEFIKLLSSIWNHIMALDFPDTTGYPKNLGGVLDFEKSLLA
jgi:DNA helicase-2/ATP-dependent DNA helicase PcrA